MSETPRIWIGTLGLYNAGFLIGEWFDATEAPQTTEEFLANESIAAQIGPRGAEFMAEVGEELWVFDYEGFDGLLTGECSPAEAQRIARLIEDAAAWELTPAHLKSYAAYTNTPLSAIDEIQVRDAFKGEVEKPWHYYFDMAEDLYGPELAALPDEIRLSIDWEQVAETYAANGTAGVYIDEIVADKCFVWES